MCTEMLLTNHHFRCPISKQHKQIQCNFIPYIHSSSNIHMQDSSLQARSFGAHSFQLALK